MKFAPIALFGLVAMIVFSQVADAQLFRRSVQRSKTVISQPVKQANCVTGQCGVLQPTRYVSPVVYTIPAVQAAPQPTKAPELPRPVSSGVTFGLDDIYSAKAAEIPKHVLAQVDEPAEVAEDPFRKSLIKAIADARKKGTINLRDAVKLRVATLSPAFIERAQELAVTQVAFSGIESSDVPMDADGVVQVEGINWEGLALFLEKLIPLILSLLKAFGV